MTERESVPKGDAKLDAKSGEPLAAKVTKALDIPVAELLPSDSFESHALRLCDAAANVAGVIPADIDTVLAIVVDAHQHAPVHPASTLHVRRLTSALRNASTAAEHVSAAADELRAHLTEK